MPNLFNHKRSELSALFVELGFERFRAEQIMRWVYHQNVLDFNQMENLPKTLRGVLQDQMCCDLPKIQQENVSRCGTVKWLFNMDGKNAVETVYIPEDKRGTLCISSQIGCALACQFCATGFSGFMRNLSTAEIITQVYVANMRLKAIHPDLKKPITNVVFMGMGEPLLNEDNVFNAIDILLDDLGYGLSKYRVTVSTSGIVPAIHRLSERSQAALALSIHAARNEVRDRIVPINKRYPLEKLMAACDAYTEATNRPITYEYVMLKDINDRPEDAKALGKLLAQRQAKVNLIPYNAIDALTLECSDEKTIEAFKQQLNRYGLITTVRKTRGDDINAACGQLYGQVFDRKKRIEDYHFIKKEHKV